MARQRYPRGSQIGSMVALVALSLLCLSPLAAQPPAAKANGRLLGLVTDALGRPEAGATVRAQRLPGKRRGASPTAIQGRTQANGTFALLHLRPGHYRVRVGAAQGMNEQRDIVVPAGAAAVLIVSLPDLVRSIHVGPPQSNRADQQYRWVLRESAETRPVLRWLDASAGSSRPAIRGGWVTVAGGGDSGFGAPGGVSTQFHLDTGLFGENQLELTGNVAMNPALPDSSLQAAFRPSLTSHQRLLVGVRQVATPGLSQLPFLRVVSLNYANSFSLGHLDVQYGSMFNTVTLASTLHSLDPYLQARYRLGPKALLEYRFASAVPPVNFGDSMTTMPDPTPRISIAHFRPQLESADHQELLYSNQITANDRIEAAIFDDQFQHTVINGTSGNLELNRVALGAAYLANGTVLPDVSGRFFNAAGGNYGGWGLRLDYHHNIAGTFGFDLGFADAPALAPVSDRLAPGMALASMLAPARRQAWTVKVSGITPATHTRVVCSYRGLSGPSATGVDLYDNGSGRSDSYANLLIAQPLPSIFFSGAGHMMAMLEVNNLLAQGYIPVLGPDGNTLYLVQSARALRGGLTVNF